MKLPATSAPLGALALLSILLYGTAPARTAETAHEVVVYGGTSSGVAAAVQAARMGRTVLLVEPGRHIGGLTSGGLGRTDTGNKAVIGGVSREFYRRIKKHYDKGSAWKQESKEDYSGYRPEADAMWGFEPRVAERIFEEMLEEAGVAVVKGGRLDLEDGVDLEDGRIASIRMENGDVYRGRMFIDATYEGDLMATAGVSYTVGRESNRKYGETLNGVQKARSTHHQFIVEVDPYVIPGDPSSGTLPGVHDGDPGDDGEGDHRVQAYCFRMCLTDVEENRVPFPKPEDYDERRFELLFRNLEAGDHRIPWHLGMMPNRKTDTNNNHAISTDNIGMNYDYPDGDYATRERIIAEHESYQKGLMWTLANHPRVPEKVRKAISRWGLAKDEFTDNGNWPHQLYIREARRMVSDYVMTEKDCRRLRVAEDSVGLGSYNMDSHNCQRYVTPEGHARNEGNIEVSPRGAYVISYRSIVPRRGEVRNLLVPVCISASHIAYGSIRMEPVFMILGQSAATAAVHAIDAKVDVQDVDYTALRRRLLEDHQVLDLPAGQRPAEGRDPAKLPGTVVDDAKADVRGHWTASVSIAPFVGTGYLHDSDGGKGSRRARFKANLPEDGRYEVRLAYSAHPNRATNVPVSVEHAGGTADVRVNQRKKPPIDGLFISLGTFRFRSDRPAVVSLTNRETDGHVIVDAVQFLPATPARSPTD